MQNSGWCCQCYCQWKHKRKKALIDHSQLQSSQTLVCVTPVRTTCTAIIIKARFWYHTAFQYRSRDLCWNSAIERKQEILQGSLSLVMQVFIAPYTTYRILAAFWARLFCKSREIQAGLNKSEFEARAFRLQKDTCFFSSCFFSFRSAINAKYKEQIILNWWELNV